MQRLVVVIFLAALTALACNPPPPGEGEGEGGEGEGEGEVVGEGEGEGGEGEGDEGEGEGDVGGEGEGEGGAGDTCGGDADCGADVCLFKDTGDFIFEGVCGAEPAGGVVGDACAVGGNDCGRGLCLSNRCSQLCASANDCAVGMACQAQSFTLDNGHGGSAQICVPDTSLPDTPCDNDADCTATGRLCNSFTDTFALQCGFPGAGSAAGGQCVSEFFENTAVCQTGLCDGEVSGMCTRACTNNADCAGTGPAVLCSSSPFTNVSGDYCAEPCSTNQQCDVAGRFCSLRDNLAGNGIDTVCIDPPGQKNFGDAAASGQECTTNLEFQGKCTRLCSGGGCEAPLPNCTSVNFPRPGGGQQPLTICGG